METTGTIFTIASFLKFFLDVWGAPSQAVVDAILSPQGVGRRISKSTQKGRALVALYALQGGQVTLYRRSGGQYNSYSVDIQPRCAYCGQRCTDSNRSELEHILPCVANGDATAMQAYKLDGLNAATQIGYGNVVIACHVCNTKLKKDQGLHAMVKMTPPQKRAAMLMNVHKVLSQKIDLESELVKVGPSDKGDLYRLQSPPAAVI